MPEQEHDLTVPCLRFLDLLATNNFGRQDLADALVSVLSDALPHADIFACRAAIADEEHDPRWVVLSRKSSHPLPQPVDLEQLRVEDAWCVEVITSTAESKIVAADWTIAVLVRCTSQSQHRFATQLLKVLATSATATVRLGFSDRIERTAFSLMQNASLFPRASDDDVAYTCLHSAVKVAPQWYSASFWRTSRTECTLEKIAELNNPKREVAREALSEWRCDPSLPSWRRASRLADVPRLPRLTIVCREDDPEALALARRTLREYRGRREKPVAIETASGSTTAVRVLWPHAYGWASDEEKEALARAIRLLMSRLSLERTEVIVIVCAELGFPSGTADLFKSKRPSVHIDERAPSPFQAIISLRVASLPALRADQLLTTERVLDRAIHGFNFVSLIRYYLRLVVKCLSRLRQATDVFELSTVLTERLAAILGSRAWMLLDRTSGVVRIASPSVAELTDTPVGVSWLAPSDVVNITAIDDSSPAILQSCRDLILTQVRDDLRGFVERGELPASARLDEDVYGTVGAAILRIDCTDSDYALVILKGHRWRLRAIEEMFLRLLRDAIAEAIGRVGRSQSARATSSIAHRRPSESGVALLSLSGPPHSIAKELLKTAQSAANCTSGLFCAVDQDARVFLPIANIRPSRTLTTGSLLQLDNTSLIGQAVLQERPLIGRREGSHLIVHRLGEPRASGRVRYWGWVEDVELALAVPLTWGFQATPHAVVLFSWSNTQDQQGQQRVFGECIELSTLARIRLERTAASQFWSRWEVIQKGVNSLRSLPGPELFMWEAVETSVDSMLPALPPDQSAVYSPEFRLAIRELLTDVSDKLDLLSVTVRVLHSDTVQGSADLILLSASREWRSVRISLEGSRSVNAYCFSESTASGSEGSLVVSVPNVRALAALEPAYPGLIYKPDRSDTVSELTISLVAKDRGGPRTVGTMNFEARDFSSLWFDRQLLRELASLLALEIVGCQTRMQHLLAGATRQALTFAYWGRHGAVRDIQSISELSREMMQLPGFRIGDPSGSERAPEIVAEIDRLAHRLSLREQVEPEAGSGRVGRTGFVNLSELAARGMRTCAELSAARGWSVRVEQRICELGRSSWTIRHDPTAEQVILWVMREQLNTLQTLAGQNRAEYRFMAALHDDKSRDTVSLSFSGDGPPIPESICDKLFWQRIRDQRPGSGSGGLGLALLGVMLRATGIYPVAHRDGLTAPWASARPEMSGGWIELIFSNSEAGQ